MQVQFVVNQRDKTIDVYLEGRFWQKLAKGLIKRDFQLETSLKELETYVASLEKKGAEKYLLRLLGLKGYLKQQLYEKLKKQGFSALIITNLIEKYSQLGYLNDTLFLQNLILKEIRKGYGRKMVLFKLRGLGFPEGEIKEALERFYPPEEEAKNLARLKQKKGNKNPAFWLRRGFSFLR